jgi:hypothetical protein
MNFNQIKFGKPVTYLDGVVNYLKGAMIWGFRSKYKWSQTTPDIWGFANPNDIDPEAQAVYDRIIADGGVSNLIRLNYFVVGLKTIYGTLANVPVCYDAHWIGYKLGSGTGATAGQAAAKLYSLTVAGDAVQTTAASQPLLLAHNGASSDNYWWGSGVSGNYVSTPNAAANSNNGNKEIILNLDITNLSAQTELINKDDVGSNRGWRIFLTSSRFITVFASTDLSAYILTPPTSDVALPLNFKGFVKITFTFFIGSLNVLFFTSSDGITYTQLGTQRSKLGNNLINTNAELAIGIVPNIGVSDKIKIYRATISNSIGGTPVVDFNPATYNAATSQTQWTSATGEIWTISTGTATTGYKGVLVDRTIVMFDGVEDKIISTQTAAQPFSQYLIGKSLIANQRYSSISGGIDAGYFGGSAGRLEYYNGSSIYTQTSTFKTAVRQLMVGIGNGATSIVSIDANAEVTGNAGTQDLNTTLILGAKSASNSNVVIDTYLISTGADNLTIRTAMKTFLKSLNNNFIYS